jgi:hypothetical protein
LDKKYPLNGTCQRDNDPTNKGKKREDITHLDISQGKVGKKRVFSEEKNLTGPLNLTGFTNLRTLKCSGHELTNLDISGCQYLTNLECQNNQLNSLQVNNCSNLEKINCSSNYISNLDLNTCPKLKEINLFLNNSLEEVDISKCPKLTKTGFGFTRRKNKLMKVSQITLAGDNIRNILIIGITGNGKSALANVLSDTTGSNKFGEGSASTSMTKNFQKGKPFEYQGKKYRIIDNIGFGDTAKISKEDILFKIGEGIHSVEEGINQILFVFKGRFAPEHVKVFNVFKEFVAETGIAEFTTLVRTNFVNFRSPGKCEEDRKILLAQSPELIEIVESCNNVIYVDNPPLPVIEDDDDEEIREEKAEEILINGGKRKESREIVLNHLAENCLEIYKLKK